MSNGNGRSATTTSDSNGDYWKQNEENSKKAEELLKSVYPDLWELNRVMREFAIPFDDILDYLYNVRFVKTHGFGTVTTTIFEKKITKIEGLIRTIRLIEIQKKV